MQKWSIISIEQVYEYPSNDKLNPYECAMINDFELYTDHTERVEIKKWSILTTRNDYVA